LQPVSGYCRRARRLPPVIETVRDLDGDGRPEALIVEGSTFC
jgi:hypothetical protein